MHTFTKVFLIVVAVVVMLIGGWIGAQNYLFNHPKVTITFYSSGDGDVNVYTIPQMELEARSVLGVSDEWDDRYFEVYDIVSKMIDISRVRPEDGEWFYDSTVEVIDGKTVFTIFGYYTENGERVDIREEYSVDYVLTDDIQEH